MANAEFGFNCWRDIMIRLILTGAALCAMTPAIAQTAATPAAPAAPTYNPAPSTAAPVDSTSTTTSSTTTTTSPSSAAAAAPATQIAAVVDSEFPAYDADKSGALNKAEFVKWVTALKTEELKSTGKTLSTSEIGSWATKAFASADVDKNANVSKTELTTYLGG
jgi:N-acetylmuramoyl-L-alanine amidase CwlA